MSNLDSKQLQAVRLMRNAVVTAGAGAGKTKVLAERYLHLCETTDMLPEEILALTFTRKAAAEMYSRIHATLLKSDNPAVRKKLNSFSKARITTIDAFCSEIAHSAAEDYGYPPEFQIDDQMVATIIRREAYAFTLKKRDQNGLAELLASFRFEDVAELFFADIAKKLIHPSSDGANPFAGMAKKAKEELDRLRAEYIRKLNEAADAARTFEMQHETFSKNCEIALAALRFWRENNIGPHSDPDVIRAACSSFLTLNLRSYSANTESAIKDIVKNVREKLAPSLDAVIVTAAFSPCYEALIQLLGEFADIVRKAKCNAAVMSFSDISYCAVDVLERRKDIRQWWNRHIKSIMIDEFQDDNATQKRLLFLLAEKNDHSGTALSNIHDITENKLFFVGDEKQSIYQFRGADVSVFKLLKNDLAASGGEALTLDTNYRSNPALIQFFNTLFSRVMAETSDDASVKKYQALYTPMSAPETLSNGKNTNSLIQYRIIPRNDDKYAEEDENIILNSDTPSLDDTLASHIALCIKNFIAEKLPIRDEKAGSRPVNYSDFAILLRSSTKQHFLEAALRRANIPFDTTTPHGLFLESIVYDLYSILKLALNPEDKVCYAAFLRSPAAGLSNDGILAILAAKLPIFQVPFDVLDTKDLAALAHGARLYEALKNKIDTMPLADLVHWLWHKGTYRLSFISRQEGRAFAEHFDFLFNIAAQADSKGKNLSEFLADIEPLLGKSGRLDLEDAPKNPASGVKIMTIHKSKGLEFPVVIIPWLENKGSSGKKDEEGPWSYSASCGVAIDIKPYDEPGAKAVNIFYSQAKELEAHRKKAELKRLLYVACTRAIDHLLFFGIEPVNADNAQTAFHTLLAGGDGKRGKKTGAFEAMPAGLHIIELHDAALFSGKGIDTPVKKISPPCAPAAMAKIYASATTVEYSCAEPIVSASAVTAVRDTQTSYAPMPPHSDISNADSFGILCHAVIAHEIAVLTKKTLSPFMPDDTLLEAWPGSEQDAIVAEAKKLSDIFFTSTLWASLLSASYIETEKPFIMRILGADEQAIANTPLITGRIDLYVEQNGLAKIIDFKTDRQENIEQHEVQMALYREAVAGFSRQLQAESYIFWLRSGKATRCDTQFPAQTLAAWALEAATRTTR